MDEIHESLCFMTRTQWLYRPIDSNIEMKKTILFIMKNRSIRFVNIRYRNKIVRTTALITGSLSTNVFIEWTVYVKNLKSDIIRMAYQRTILIELSWSFAIYTFDRTYIKLKLCMKIYIRLIKIMIYFRIFIFLENCSSFEKLMNSIL